MNLNLARFLLIVLLVLLLMWAWYKGERSMRRRVSEPDDLARMFIALWRLLMLAVTAVAVVTIVGLWWAQDASDRASTATARLCYQNQDWQQTAVDIRRADVRIASSELIDARAELADAQAAIADAKNLGVLDNPFVASFLDRDVRRAQERIASLEEEEGRRAETLELIEANALDECPPLKGR